MSNHRDFKTSRPHGEGAFSDQRSDFDVWTAGRLDVSQTPDLTRRIMGQLGYMRVPEQVARRRRMRLWAGRCSCVALAGLAVLLGVKAFEASPEARRPAEVTIPAAVSHDLQQQQHRLGSMIRLIQQVPAGLDGRASDHNQSEGSSNHDEPDYGPTEIDDEVNRSAIAPVRWV